MFDASSVPNADKYCPVCSRTIRPSNLQEVADGDHDGFIYVHDDIPHDDDDLSALNRGMQ